MTTVIVCTEPAIAQALHIECLQAGIQVLSLPIDIDLATVAEQVVALDLPTMDRGQLVLKLVRDPDREVEPLNHRSEQ